jgi:hypothetical protein
MTGGAVLVGGEAATAVVAALVALALPSGLVAVTTTCRTAPSSAAVTV